MPWPDFGRGSGDRANYCKHFEHRLRSVLLSGKVDDMIQFSVKLLGKHLCICLFFHGTTLTGKGKSGWHGRPSEMLWDVPRRVRVWQLQPAFLTVSCGIHAVQVLES